MGFFAGRYGIDKLNRTLFWTSVILNIIALALNLIFGTAVYNVARIVQGAALLIIIYALIRAMSRNFPRRQQENAAYMRLENKLRGVWMRVKGRGQNVVEMRNEHKHYRHLTCPQCMQKLRVPRGKGKIIVTCTKCRCKFEAKT